MGHNYFYCKTCLHKQICDLFEYDIDYDVNKKSLCESCVIMEYNKDNYVLYDGYMNKIKLNKMIADIILYNIKITIPNHDIKDIEKIMHIYLETSIKKDVLINFSKDLKYFYET